MNPEIPQTKFTLALLVIVCLIAGVLAFRQRHQSVVTTPPEAATARSQADVAGDWRADVTRLLSEYDQNQDARAAEQGLLALHVVDQDRELHLKIVLAFHALGESRPEGKAELLEARRLFVSSAGMLR